MLEGKNITLYVTGSIAAYKALILTRFLMKRKANVRVVMTTSAQKFVTPLSFQTLSKNSVLTDQNSGSNFSKIDHIELAQWTDLAIIAPITADFIGKIANGLADDFASSSLLATSAPKIIAPAMNDQMWTNSAVQRNIKILQDDGIRIINPGTGFLAEGYEGTGRMAEPDEIINSIESMFVEHSILEGKKVIVTAGGTRERIDPVRFIGNDSSGKMGYSIAKAFYELGADVTLISGPTKLDPLVGINIVPVTNVKQLKEEVELGFKSCDILVMAAAVADFKPVKTSKQKIKKDPRNDLWEIKLEKTPDILKSIAKIKSTNQIIVGFAAETENIIINATKKLMDKSLDLVVANDVSKPGVGFNGDTNQVTFITKDSKPETTALLSKKEIAELVVKRVENLMNDRKSSK
ncbi:bifunctional phosphopantothenoylcysteine decarboxylase/phosphopantothenate--cysteine ligase CoaBC [Xylocopilactobacillus apis]|uniref:Coenzyme A biosynthesis bifunctional protein CoaBC n=1 Tax=Xylocopilactobacillus apis TaxID=2932183 RepID=A0AAU9DL95_9LACO|nr:bifunctional phosphopantothenoylcysteine decarboxylase/phosphopantothenate--cysteine ligase CoaBC [Xylocopilactobacillus apis]BDR55568.1 DNA/pantothenate metabolism flavoprotein [Xylocopilactobacillus apis]